MNFRELTVLIIDDSTFIRDLVKTLLQGLGVRKVLEASDGISGLGIVSKKKVDLILCDLSMEPMSGFGFVEALRNLESEELQEIPIIILTVHDEANYVEQAIKDGVDGYLLKPISGKKLEERIVQVLKSKKKI